MTNYYVKSYADGGRDSHTGDSHEQAWETIAKVNSFSFNTGDCVYFKCGDTWNNAHLTIDWSGTNDFNRTVVGAYYLDGSETVGVNIDGRPIFDTGWDLVTQGEPTRFEKTIWPMGVDYITVQDLILKNSHGYGIYNGWQTQSVTGYNNFFNIHVEDTGRAGIATFYMGSNNRVEYCKVMRDDREFFIGEAANWDSGIRIRGNNSICRYCEVGNGWGEGIGVSPGSVTSNILVENNLVWGRRSVGLYMGCCAVDATVRNNIVIGTTNTDYHQEWVYGGRTWNGAGIGLNQENEGQTTFRNKIYNNVVIGCMGGIQAINKPDRPTVGYDNRHLAYNNTLIDNWDNIYTHVNADYSIDTEFKNNLSYITSEGAILGCDHVFTSQNVGPTGIYRPLGNFWSSTPEHAVWEHANDVIGDPKMSRTSGWLSISEPSDIDIAAGITLLSGSAAINSALNLGDTYEQTFIEGCDFNTPDASDVATPLVIVTGDQDSYGSSWDFGARIFTGTVIRGAGILALM